jgi:hypothetical protein
MIERVAKKLQVHQSSFLFWCLRFRITCGKTQLQLKRRYLTHVSAAGQLGAPLAIFFLSIRPFCLSRQRRDRLIRRLNAVVR